MWKVKFDVVYFRNKQWEVPAEWGVIKIMIRITTAMATEQAKVNMKYFIWLYENGFNIWVVETTPQRHARSTQ